MRANAVIFSRVANERAPAAANVEKGLAWLEAQLATYDVEFITLRCREVVFPVFEISAGVNHLWIEKELVECIREIVMVADVLLVRGLAAISARLVAADLLQWPRPTARHKQKPRHCGQQQMF